MADFTDEHKEEFQGNYFEQGIHKVTIGKIEFGKTDEGKEYAEFTLIGEAEQEDSARVWFTTDAAIKYSFNTIRSIFVHNAPEEKKEDFRKKFDALKNTKELEAACQKILVGKECWYSVYENPNRPYTKKDGNTGFSYDKNIYGYEPSPQYVKPSKVLDGDEAKSSNSKKDDVEIEDTDQEVNMGF